MRILTWAVLLVAVFPFCYYLIAIFSVFQYFRTTPVERNADFTPPISNLKPVRGVDREAYENFASLCTQDYPDYELLFCVDGEDDAVVPILRKLIEDFPERQIRILFGSGRAGTNDKVCKLARLVSEARHETLVINDSDVWVEPDYFRTIVAPLRNAKVGAVTCFYDSREEKTFADKLQNIGMVSDFFAGIIVAWRLDGVKFALGTTIATTRAHIAGFGGYEALENRPADDLLVGRLIAQQGFEVKLLPYSVLTVPDYSSMRELFFKRLRWITVMRHMRPGAHLGLVFTQGLAWSLLAIAVHPTVSVVCAYLGIYVVLRVILTWMIGGWGLKRAGVWKKIPLLVVWDAVAFSLWLVSFARTRIRWRNGEYAIRKGQLVPITAKPLL